MIIILQDASGAESPESSDEKIQNRTGNLLKNLLSPVYSLFKVDRHNEHSSYSQGKFPPTSNFKGPFMHQFSVCANQIWLKST